jgi:hypothetical protein
MAPLTPRDVYLATVLGGGLLGLALIVLGLIVFSASYNAGGDGDELIDLAEAATFFLSGVAFVLVSVVVVPAMRAMRLETSGKP